jgi:hypothetical protein
MARMNPKKGDKEPKVHKELDGFDININRRQVLLGQSFIFKDMDIFIWSVI